MSDGLLVFARYAYPPNRLGYCGSEDHEALGGYLGEGRVDEGLAGLARQFEGAYPYLRLIASVNGIEDPFDPKVVRAYWVGNALLERVGAAPFFESLAARFRRRTSPRSFARLTDVLPLGARPHHNFHVFEVYRRAGLMRDARATVALERMDQCRISWGTILSVQGSEVVAQRAPLALQSGRVVLGASTAVHVQRHPEPPGPGAPWAPGDVVSIHWSWACERLDRQGLARLAGATRRAIAHLNLSL